MSAAAVTVRTEAVRLALAELDALLERALAAVERVHGVAPGADPHRGLYVSPADARRLLGREAGAPLFAVARGAAGGAAAELQRAFALTRFDLDALLIALAPEVDLRYERIYAFLQDDVTRRRPSVDLVLDLLCRSPDEKLAARARFAPDAPLVSSGLVRLLPEAGEAERPLLAHAVVVDPQIARMLLGVPGAEPRLAGVAELVVPAEGPADARELALARLAAAGGPLVIALEGRARAGKRRAAAATAHELGLRLLVVDLSRVHDERELEEVARLALAEARIRRALPYVVGLDRLLPDGRPLADALAADEGLVLLGAAERPPWLDPAAVSVEFGALPYPARLERWRDAVGEAAAVEDVVSLAARFRFSGGQIDAAVEHARARARWRAAQTGTAAEPTAPELFAGARAQSAPRLGRLAAKVEPRSTRADLVLPAEQLGQLDDIVAEASHRHVVFGDWGFERKLSLGRGLNVLFAGAPGTGKTMAAEVLAHELQLDLYKIDLSQVVSKYIGETERNLAEVFHEAATTAAILFFDEADALFGKRSEVKDAHDRYANLEIAYLLQKMEEYEGVVILATNLRQNVDRAFLRRLQHIVEFPEPDEAQRRRIWERLLPRELPVGEDVDFSLLAREIELPGGNIKNIALAAAFTAAANGGVVRMPHFERAARREFRKLGRSWERV